MYQQSSPRIWRRVLLLTLALAGLLTLGARAGAAQPEPFPRAPRGQDAVDALGDRLPAVAAAYGHSAESLAELFRHDLSLSVDRHGELYYIDPAFAGDAAQSAREAAQAINGPFPNEDTFQLQSLPGANHTIYLDFDGHTTTGTTWNSSYGVPTIVSPPYDLDGNTANWSQTELDRIQRVWQIVAEDFSPFAVNVTTLDPGVDALSKSGTNDTTWGVRVVITGDDWSNCGCGGHAYIGSFDDSVDEPVFVYNSSETGVSEASSHEVGHALNLSHDGTSTLSYYGGHGSGDTSWGPIMGAAYNRNVTHWSKGDYFDANNAGGSANYGNGPDDLAVIASLTNGNGFGYRADDHGNNNAGATALTVAGAAVSGAGIVGGTTDVDVFSFTTGAGAVSLSILPDPSRPNLDVLATLYDVTNTLVATSDSSSLLTASFNLTLGAGTYFLHIDGTGTGSPLTSPPSGYTEYGSIGQYSVSGTIVDPGNGQGPTAVAAATPTSGTAPLVVAFSSADSTDPDGTIVTTSWDFGDGATSSDPNPQHTYSAEGSFTATLTVIDNDGFSDSDSVIITVTPPPPAAPTNLSATAVSESQIDLTWSDNSSNESGFYIERATDGVTFSQIASVGANVTAYSDGGLDAGTAYDYRVRAYNATGTSAYSNVAGATTNEPPAYVDIVASGEIASAGTVSGSYLDTTADGGGVEALTERESGGRPANRTSYLEHTYTFNVSPGVSLMVMANAWAPANAEGDTFTFAWSTDNNNFVTMFSAETAADDPDTYLTFALPSNLNGTVYVRVTDSDRTAGNRNLDTVYVDHLFIRKQNAQGDPPAAPGNLQASAASASQIDLTWDDNAGDEFGFTVLRATDGVTFSAVATLGIDSTAYSDSGLDANTTYYYQVVAYNGAGDSAPSNTASATTPNAPTMHVADLDGSGASTGNRWTATVTILVVDGNGAPVANATVSGGWTNGASGGASCTTNGSGVCSVSKGNLKNNVSSVTFTVTDVTAAGYLYDAGSNSDGDGDSDGTTITVLKP